MTDTKRSALELDPSAPTGTYITYVRPHQLRRTDVYQDERRTRNVVIHSVTAGEIGYRGRLAPVLFVTGYDPVTQLKVLLTKTAWEFLEVRRIGDAPAFRRVIRSTDQYVY